MPEWGELFADPEMQRRAPNPDLMALLPVMKEGGCRVLDAGCGVGRHLLPLREAGFQVWGVDRDAKVMRMLAERLAALPALAGRILLARADLKRLPFPGTVFDLVVSVNVINHGVTADFLDYCRELHRVLKRRGRLFINVAPKEFGERVRLPQTRELEPGTLVNIATPDGDQVHHFPTPAELLDQFPNYRVERGETILAPTFMGKVMPQFVFWGQKGG
jgi:SAM-dependent methyltransferase